MDYSFAICGDQKHSLVQLSTNITTLRRLASLGRSSVPNTFSSVHIGSGATTEAIGSSKDRGKGQPTFGKSEQVQVDLNSVVSLETTGSIRFVVPTWKDSLNQLLLRIRRHSLVSAQLRAEVLSLQATQQ